MKDKFSDAYKQGVHSFLEFAYRNLDLSQKVHCPCRKCANIYYQNAETIAKHLLEYGIMFSYSKWYLHGETDDISNIDNRCQNDQFNDHDEMFEMLQAIQDERMVDVGFEMEVGDSRSNNDQNEESGMGMDKLLENALRPLFSEWPHSSLLSFVIRMLKVKVECRISDKAFDLIFAILHDVVPKDNFLPKNYLEAKKLLRDLGLGYDPIHACKNDCVLFWKDLKDLNECPVCHESRYKISDCGEVNNKAPQKVMRFFPLKPRLKRLFMSKEIAYDMRWHKEKRLQEDNTIRHPADGDAWKHLDEKFPEFAQDSRNVRLGLASDGFNPFGNMSNSYSMWPVMLMPYNLPPWLCMKDDYTILSTLIPGPKAPGKDIDVYLQPLIDELRDLWHNGVRTYDAHSKSAFTLHAIIIWTINDFPAYGDLSGWSTKGKLACPICNENTYSNSILDKICFMGHRRYLPKDHHWRKSKKFNGKVECGGPPIEMTGDDILSQLAKLPEMKFGKSLAKKKRKRGHEELNWTKKSIFFELPYWKELKIRHILDVMHIEKNVFDNILGTLLSIEGKNKDNEKARKDLEAMKIRKELHLKSNNGRFYKPPACYTLTSQERYGFYQFLKSVRFPDGYAAKISRCVRDTKIFGLKSHDCHVMLQRLLPIGMRGHLDKKVLNVITELSSFFRELCSKILHRDALMKLQEKIIIILCNLEMIFPPAFFDVMVHLTVHLPHEAMLSGPVHYRWMYPVER
ncbi:MAG: DUF4218 domain-containing protein [Gammaproteobacteria bacterium]|nr:DUF4218 domain-containing protein [Gammaproteobacteria bacterium]